MSKVNDFIGLVTSGQLDPHNGYVDFTGDKEFFNNLIKGGAGITNTSSYLQNAYENGLVSSAAVDLFKEMMAEV